MKIDIDLTEQDIKNIIAESLSLNNKELGIKPEDVKLCSCDIGINRIYSANVRFEEKETKEQPDCRCECLNIPIKKTCVIYSRNKNRAMQKLLEIQDKKILAGARIVSVSRGDDYRTRSVLFDDGILWKIINKVRDFDGIEWHECYVDHNDWCLSEIIYDIQPHAAPGSKEYITTF